MAWSAPMLPGALLHALAVAAPLSALACSAASPPRAPQPAGPQPSSVPAARPAPSDAPVKAPEPDPAPVEEPAATAQVHHGAETVEDGFETTVVDGEERPHPFAHLSDEELASRLRDDPASLGSLSIGRPSNGRLLNAVRMPDGDNWRLVDSEDAWGTQETVDYLQTAINAVAEAFPGTLPLPIGHISDRDGGPLRPHISHQAGRDVDLGYYYVGDGSWYRRANAETLDVERTWALVRALVTRTDVELILIDARLQRLLRAHAESVGEDPDWLDDLFRGRGSRPALIRHAPGHATHLHVRFFNPKAQETARRCLDALVEQGLIEPPTYYVHHRVRRGETLGKLAKRYGTTVRAIQRANGLRSTLIQAKKTYRIPRSGPPPHASHPVRVPPRRLPPRRSSERPEAAGAKD